VRVGRAAGESLADGSCAVDDDGAHASASARRYGCWHEAGARAPSSSRSARSGFQRGLEGTPQSRGPYSAVVTLEVNPRVGPVGHLVLRAWRSHKRRLPNLARRRERDGLAT
jgi:hypothetical protein